MRSPGEIGRAFRRLRVEMLSQCAGAAALALLLAALPAAAGDAGPGEPLASRARYLMGTVCTLTLPEPQAEHAEAAFAEIARIEDLISTWRKESALSQLNAAGAAEGADHELYELLRSAMTLSDRTGGAFNPLVGPLIVAWKTREEGRLPAAGELARARVRTRLENVVFDDASRSISLLEQAAIEEGAFGKGYALDRAVALLRRAGVERAIFDFGGQVASFGFDRFEVAVADPRDRDRPALAFAFGGGSIATTSGSEKSFQIDGRRFSHLIDPRSGEALPPRGSVTVVHDEALTADILSTALYVMGPADGLRWAEENGVAALFVVPGDGDRHTVHESSSFRQRNGAVRSLHQKFEVRKTAE